MKAVSPEAGQEQPKRLQYQEEECGELAPLEDPIAGQTYEDNRKEQGVLKGTAKLYDGTSEFERTDGEWRSYNVQKVGRTMSPLGMDPDLNRWTGRRKTRVTAVYPIPPLPQMSSEGARHQQDDWQAAEDPRWLRSLRSSGE